MGFVSRFFCVVESRVFGEKRVFVRGVLWIADGKMCGKRGLRDALFGVEAGSISMGASLSMQSGWLEHLIIHCKIHLGPNRSPIFPACGFEFISVQGVDC